MRAVVIYESMYGNTHHIAEAIATGLREGGDAAVMSVHEATADVLDGADLVVVGGPTHVHGMSRPSSRKGAFEAAEDPDADLTLDPDAAGPGVREWLEALGTTTAFAAAFDTRIDIAPVLSGRASKGIAKGLRHHGFDVVVEPESFLVTKETHLEPGEEDRARTWGRHLGEVVAASAASSEPAR